jgi:hypothetical protein
LGFPRLSTLAITASWLAPEFLFHDEPLPPEVSILEQTNGPWTASVEVFFQPNRRGVGKSLTASRPELWRNNSHQSGSFPFVCWLLARPCARANVLQLTRCKDFSLTAQTHLKCSASKRARGVHFRMLRRQCSVQRKQRDFARSLIKQACLKHFPRSESMPASRAKQEWAMSLPDFRPVLFCLSTGVCSKRIQHLSW